MAILRKALQRDPARRYSSAGEMGQACEHHLYDEGYGPTNLALKRYLSTLFPAERIRPGRWRIAVEPTSSRSEEGHPNADPEPT